ncbi:MAG: ATP synthase F1 subunit epsilon [Bdellovibrionaceae bacterium]|nr:ATP synthase F1 subunit epsilon [Pseudobdellovibrionaceae bacterium]
MSLKLSIVTPVKKVVTDLEIESVTIPAYKGEVTILDQHASLITTLESGVLSYKAKGSTEEQRISVSWGYCEILGGEISVLAETAETKNEVDTERAKLAIEKSIEAMAQTEDVEVIEKYNRKLKRAEARLNL